MSEKSIEAKLNQFEERLTKLEGNIPKCPNCGYILSGCEHGKYHMQCYACGCWWNLVKPLNEFIEETGFKGKLPKDVIPNRRTP